MIQQNPPVIQGRCANTYTRILSQSSAMTGFLKVPMADEYFSAVQLWAGNLSSETIAS